MKNKALFTLVVALALLSSCIKDEGELLTIDRSNWDNDSTTIVTDGDGLMIGTAKKDSIVMNSFETILNNNQIQRLNCYTTLHTEFKKLDLERNSIKEVGYVYSLKNKAPVITDKTNCKVYTYQNDKYIKVPKVHPDDPDSIVSPYQISNGQNEITFEGTLNDLDFNSTYYVRAYAKCKGDGKTDSIIYNQNVLEYKTVLPEDVWYERNQAPAGMPARADAFCCNSGEDVYVYGGRNGNTLYNDLWKYDNKNDTWEQMPSFDETKVRNQIHIGQSRRCNGAMLAYPTARDTLLFIIGGELSNGDYTGTIFYYSTKERRYADQRDHPNVDSYFELHDDYGNPVYEYVYEKNDDGSYKLDENGNKIIAKNSDGTLKFVPDEDGSPKHMQVKSSRNYIEELPIYRQDPETRKKTYYGLAGCVAFPLTDNGKTKFFVAFGKNNASKDGQKHISTAVYVYDIEYDWDRQGSDLDNDAWKTISATNEGFYQPVCVKCGDKVVIGSGESSNNNKLSKNFYTLSYRINNPTEIQMNSLPKPGDDFEPRANAAAFYLNYTKKGSATAYDRFYIGTGRKCLESEYEKSSNKKELLLNDFWCFDFVKQQWFRKADCSNIVRQGAVGFSVKRDDDRFADDYFVKNFGENIRGMFSFGEGYVPASNVGDGEESGYMWLSDNWEYIP